MSWGALIISVSVFWRAQFLVSMLVSKVEPSNVPWTSSTSSTSSTSQVTYTMDDIHPDSAPDSAWQREVLVCGSVVYSATNHTEDVLNDIAPDHLYTFTPGPGANQEFLVLDHLRRLCFYTGLGRTRPGSSTPAAQTSTPGSGGAQCRDQATNLVRTPEHSRACKTQALRAQSIGVQVRHVGRLYGQH